MHTPHPWRALRGLAEVHLHWRHDLPEHINGATHGELIWMRADLHQVERRCVLAHELEHHRRGHRDCQPPAVERQVEHHAARYLLPDPRLVGDALVWSGLRLEEAADVLWVTTSMLTARLDRRHLHPAERALIEERIAAADLGA